MKGECLVLQITISKRAALIIAVAVMLVIPGIAGATHLFTDVSDGGTHTPGITWVADVGVTTGCGDGSTYCPNDSVSRAQMGTFMYRLSGNDPATAPSVNADKLDGLDSTAFLGVSDQATDSALLGGFAADDLVRAAYAVAPFGAVVTDGIDDFTILSTAITAPVDGLLIIHASSDVWNYTNDSGAAGCAIELDGVQVDSSVRQFQTDAATDGTNREEDCATDTVVPVMAGDYTIDFVTAFSPADLTNFDESVLWALFVPFGSDGSQPIDFTVVGPVIDSPGNS